MAAAGLFIRAQFNDARAGKRPSNWFRRQLWSLSSHATARRLNDVSAVRSGCDGDRELHPKALVPATVDENSARSPSIALDPTTKE